MIVKVVGSNFESIVREKGFDTVIFNLKRNDFYYSRIRKVIERLNKIINENKKNIIVGEYDTSLNEYEDSIEFESHPGVVLFTDRVGDKLENLAFYHGKITTKRIISFINDLGSFSNRMKNITKHPEDQRLDDEEESQGVFTLTEDDRNFDVHSDSKELNDKLANDEKEDEKDINMDEIGLYDMVDLQKEGFAVDKDIKIFKEMQKKKLEEKKKREKNQKQEKDGKKEEDNESDIENENDDVGKDDNEEEFDKEGDNENDKESENSNDSGNEDHEPVVNLEKMKEMDELLAK